MLKISPKNHSYPKTMGKGLMSLVLDVFSLSENEFKVHLS